MHHNGQQLLKLVRMPTVHAAAHLAVRRASGEGMTLFATLMEAEGISPAEIHTLMVDNPRKLLGL